MYADWEMIKKLSKIFGGMSIQVFGEAINNRKHKMRGGWKRK